MKSSKRKFHWCTPAPQCTVILARPRSTRNITKLSRIASNNHQLMITLRRYAFTVGPIYFAYNLDFGVEAQHYEQSWYYCEERHANVVPFLIRRSSTEHRSDIRRCNQGRTVEQVLRKVKHPAITIGQMRRTENDANGIDLISRNGSLQRVSSTVQGHCGFRIWRWPKFMTMDFRKFISMSTPERILAYIPIHHCRFLEP